MCGTCILNQEFNSDRKKHLLILENIISDIKKYYNGIPKL